MKPAASTYALVGAINLVRAHLHLVKTGAAPHGDPQTEVFSKACDEYLRAIYDAHEPDVFEQTEKLAWEAVLGGKI